MILVYLCFLHFIADFILQSRKMGQSKSSHLGYLTLHIAIIHVIFLSGTGNLLFATLNSLIHFIIDATIWNMYKMFVWKKVTGTWYPKTKKDKLRGLVKQIGQVEKYRYWKDHWFYVTIGFDQFLHISTIILLWEYVK